MSDERKPNSSATIAAIKAATRERDGYQCVRCGMTQKAHQRRYGKALDVHRVHPGKRYDESPLETLCRPCHSKAEKRRRGEPDVENPRANTHKTIQLPRELMRKIKLVCAFRGLKAKSYIAAALKDVIEQDFKTVLGEIEVTAASFPVSD